MVWNSRRVDNTTSDALYAGVPTWLEGPVLHWAATICEAHGGTRVHSRSRGGTEAILQEFELATRRSPSLVDALRESALEGVRAHMEDEEWLDFIDLVLSKTIPLPWGDGNPSAERLEELLATGGSEWTVGERDGMPSLVTRVPEGVALAASETIKASGTAGSLLGEAWHSLFGRAPDYEEAYEKAIKAVEEAGAHILLPKNPKATLGTMSQTLEDQSAWKLALGDDPKHPSQDVVAKMARALWSGQESRHGGNGYRKPTKEEAEAAVMLAVPLVQWFSSGAVAQRP